MAQAWTLNAVNAQDRGVVYFIFWQCKLNQGNQFDFRSVEHMIT